VKEVQPSGEEVEISKVNPKPPQQVAQNNPPPAQAAQSNPPAARELPKTASLFPLMGLVGFSLVGAGLLLRLSAKKLY
jgi:hypothetical protein